MFQKNEVTRQGLKEKGILAAVQKAGRAGLRKETDAECIVCRQRMAGIYRFDGKRYWLHLDHQCDEKKINQIEGIRRGIDGRKPRTPTESERLYEGLSLMETE